MSVNLCDLLQLLECSRLPNAAPPTVNLRTNLVCETWRQLCDWFDFGPEADRHRSKATSPQPWNMFGSNQAACAQNQSTPTSTLCWTQTLTHRKLQMWLLLSQTVTALWVWATSSHRVTWVHLMNEVQCSLHFRFCFGLHQLHGKRLVSDWSVIGVLTLQPRLFLQHSRGSAQESTDVNIL